MFSICIEATLFTWEREYRMKHKITIQDIAKLAGVSKAPVSRVLNQKPTVAPAIREHILKIVEEYDFVLNMIN